MLGIITFIVVFLIIVVVHEFGHFYFAKRAGILVREFSVGMGPKIFAHIGKDGTAYTVRILPLGGYVRLAGWGDDETEIKTGQPVSLTVNADGLVTRINLSERQLDMDSIPMNVTSFDLEDQLEIKGLVLGQEKVYPVFHDATIVEEDGTEVRIAPQDVQYQNASVWGKFMTNFAGPMNNFILGIATFILLIFMMGGSPDVSTNQVTVAENGALQAAGVQTGDRIRKVNDVAVSSYREIQEEISKQTQNATSAPAIKLLVEQDGQEKEITVTAKKEGKSFFVGVSPYLKTGIWDKIVGGFQMAGDRSLAIFNALKNIIFHFDIRQLGGPVAIYSASNQAASQGILTIISLLGLLSINLGIVNLLPIPALDGGKIVFNLIEAIRRKPLSKEVEMYITVAGAIFMIVLMIVVTWNDIMRVFF
ncbi:RIP metalloprotease RseP [Streptococcus sp. DD13]|uniref:RIP metalloprotease RseP n=1 Tax=Streptococcus sp. DD13 TaxID=1777881 RepID=UPI00079915C7|nr:RIP metalloprotease RseP [Streptococcus sp. DD13]KXT77750.1 Intramembrane protease RasP/YluC, implicated in cell division based on FtsL cleavage [Streptococcus sp. DD13]